MKFALASSPHQRVNRDTGQIMRMVCYAALPGIAMQCWFFGMGVLVHLLIASATAVATEALILELRKKDFERAVKDCSALLTALLIAVSIPPFAPWWITVIGTVFAIGVVKQLYGGLGFNLFNPAMAAYVMLLVSFPVQMTAWLPPQSLAEQSHNLMDAISIIFSGFTTEGYSISQLRVDVDGVTLATPLDAVKTGLTQGKTVSETLGLSIFNGATGIGWFAVNAAFLLGGLFLLQQRVISWHMPISMLAGLALTASFFYLLDSDQYSSPWFHLFSGGAMLGAFFIVTDPVSGSTTRNGRLIFGAAIGIWVYIIRQWGGYPDAIAFAVLIMNMAVPLIDYYTQPRTYGHRSNSSNKGARR
ncbi:electron transport complex subunit RsxD [Aestuariibacter salexigens]|uniref:electron transport complex subunit RsxD n=1 Tax=Aestuariibacter salexigens TaxID=226010 RepID=UPI0004038033|nr:electron transport complex subunit RsxD [Aestuariibacter salexigens]